MAENFHFCLTFAVPKTDRPFAKGGFWILDCGFIPHIPNSEFRIPKCPFVAAGVMGLFF
jgi:hypothetical protein